MGKRKTYGYDRVKLSEAYPVSVLVEMAQEIRDDLSSANDGPIFLYNKNARRKLDNISWAIRFRIQTP